MFPAGRQRERGCWGGWDWRRPAPGTPAAGPSPSQRDLQAHTHVHGHGACTRTATAQPTATSNGPRSAAARVCPAPRHSAVTCALGSGHHSSWARLPLGPRHPAQAACLTSHGYLLAQADSRACWKPLFHGGTTVFVSLCPIRGPAVRHSWSGGTVAPSPRVPHRTSLWGATPG